MCKNDAHILRLPSDYIGTECRQCFDDRQHRYDARRRNAMALLRDIERRSKTIRTIN